MVHLSCFGLMLVAVFLHSTSGAGKTVKIKRNYTIAEIGYLFYRQILLIYVNETVLKVKRLCAVVTLFTSNIISR